MSHSSGTLLDVTTTDPLPCDLTSLRAHVAEGGRPWDEQSIGLVVAGNVAKFNQHPDLGRYLSGTANRILVEASPVDRVWGIGLAAADPRAEDPARWRGQNLLGFALMRARTQLDKR